MRREPTTTRKALLALGKKIEDLRLGKRWNRTRLAEEAGVSIRTLTALEEATKVTQARSLRKIAKALGVSVKRLEADDTKDPRVKHWTDEDYEIGNWYHNAPRALKNRIWALQEQPETGQALTDPQLAPLLEAWPKLSQTQKNFILKGYSYFHDNPDAHDDTGGVDALAATDTKTRGPQR